MFDTSVVNSRAAGGERRVGVLSVSLAAHSLVICTAVAASIVTVDFPRTAPDQMALAPSMIVLTVPPPLGNPNGGARPQPAAAQPKPAPAQPSAPVEPATPSAIPDALPTPDVSTARSTGDGPFNPNATEPGPIGVPDGDPNSVASPDAVPSTTAATPDNRVYKVGGDVRPPRVLRRVEPRYPPVMVQARKAATVRVRCIIDRNGGVADAEIVFSTFPAFNEAALTAVRQWRFSPGSMNGNAVDTEFDLTIVFQVK